MKRGLVGAPDTGAAVVPCCAAPGSVGDRSLPLAWSAGVPVWVTYPAPLWKGKCWLRAQHKFVVPIELGVGPGGVRALGFTWVLTLG